MLGVNTTLIESGNIPKAISGNTGEILYFFASFSGRLYLQLSRGTKTLTDSQGRVKVPSLHRFLV